MGQYIDLDVKKDSENKDCKNNHYIFHKKDFYERTKKMIKREYDKLDSNVQNLIYLSEENDDYNLVGNAIKNYVDLDEDEEVFFCFDNTILKSAKDGLILTNKAIHCQNKIDHPWKINLNEIESIKFKSKLLAKIYINDKKIDCASLDKHTKEFIEFLEICINYIKNN